VAKVTTPAERAMIARQHLRSSSSFSSFLSKVYLFETIVLEKKNKTPQHDALYRRRLLQLYDE
jgi:hypothetical protein